MLMANNETILMETTNDTDMLSNMLVAHGRIYYFYKLPNSAKNISEIILSLNLTDNYGKQQLSENEIHKALEAITEAHDDLAIIASSTSIHPVDVFSMGRRRTLSVGEWILIDYNDCEILNPTIIMHNELTAVHVEVKNRIAKSYIKENMLRVPYGGFFMDLEMMRSLICLSDSNYMTSSLVKISGCSISYETSYITNEAIDKFKMYGEGEYCYDQDSDEIKRARGTRMRDLKTVVADLRNLASSLK